MPKGLGWKEQLRFRVVDGHTLQRGNAVYAGGEEFDAGGDEADELLESGLVDLVARDSVVDTRRRGKGE